MKKIFISIAIVAMAATLPRISNAQASKDVTRYLLSPSAATGNNTREIKITSANIRAVRNFARTHNSLDAKWFKTETGLAATYLSDGKNAKSFYDARGMWQYEIISYTEQLLEKSIRHIVKSRYYDNAIIGVHEFRFDSKTVYVVKMQDPRSNFMTIKVSDGQIEDITSNSKK